MYPVLFKIGPLTVTGFYFFGIIGILSCFFIVIKLLTKEGFKTSELIYLLILWASISFMGSKLFKIVFYIFTNLNLFLQDPMIILRNFRYLGSMFYGGFIAAVLFYFFYVLRKYKEKSVLILDAASVGAAIGQAIGRLGCFFSGCCFGKPTDLPWGVTFSKLSTRPHPYSGTAVHPTQIYESILSLANFAILLMVYRKRKFRGQIYPLYLINYGLIRFSLEYLRADVDYLIKGTSPLLSFTVFQAISLLLIMGGLFFYNWQKKNVPA